MRKVIKRKIENNPARVVILIGAQTFIFGFALWVLLNFWLIYKNSPLIQLRSTLAFKSAIIGDGVILPITNMIIVAFLLNYGAYITGRILRSALYTSFFFTALFHFIQAKYGFVNWAMPQPWHWNGIGLAHALYMFLVIFLTSLFYLTSAKVKSKTGNVPREGKFVSGGIIIFLILLAWDYGLIG